jgi:hypothetical protein
MLEQLRSEGWQFLELSGRFSGFYTPRETPTHANQFLFFCHAVEKLKMKQVEEEYYKSTEANIHSNGGTHINNNHKQETIPDIETGKQNPKNTVLPQIPAFYTDGLIPPTPLNPQLQQLLQALTVEGVNVSKSNHSEGSSEMSMRPEVQRSTSTKESVLQQTSENVSKAEPNDRGRTQVSTNVMEQKPSSQENS